MDVANQDSLQLGQIVLFGSGETSPSGRKIFNTVLEPMGDAPVIALVETPAGFELNSEQVIGRVAAFLEQKLQNYHPRIQTIHARSRSTRLSPDNPEIVSPMLTAEMIFMGPGSPSYAVRQLQGSLAWWYLLARHRLGAVVALASAAVVAASAYALPVYEIYKVGEELHWKPGLDLFSSFGLPLVFIPHWNNQDGGAELDTSRCFMGKSRFIHLIQMLPPDLTIMGIDENTALIMDLHAGICRVMGLGGVTLIHTGPNHQGALPSETLAGAGLDEVAEQRQGHVHHFKNGESFHLNRLGDFQRPKGGEGIPQEIWTQALEAHVKTGERRHDKLPPQTVISLAVERQAARERQDWAAADELRRRIADFGWEIRDTPDGYSLEKL